MGTIVICLILTVLVAFAINSVKKRIRFGSACCGTHDPLPKKIRVADKGIVNGVGMTHSVRGSFYAELGKWQRAGGTAMLDEINACTKDFYIGDGENDGKSFFRYRCMGSTNQDAFGFNVCNNLFMLDSYDNKYKRGALNYSQVSDNVSNFLFAMESGSAAQEISEGNFCNITNTQIQATVTVPYIKGFCATGMYVVQTWEEIVRKYVKEKFIYQMFQHGFVGSDAFELSPNDKTLTEANQTFSKELDKLRK